MAENFHEHITPNIWPPNSADPNPLDYYVLSVIESEVKEHHPHITNDSLKGDIVNVMNQCRLIRACRRFQRRIETVIEAEHGFTE